MYPQIVNVYGTDDNKLSSLLDPLNYSVIKTVDVAPFGIAEDWETRIINFGDANVQKIELPNNTIKVYVSLQDGLDSEYFTVCHTGTPGAAPDANAYKRPGDKELVIETLNFIGKSIYLSTDGAKIQLIILKTGGA